MQSRSMFTLLVAGFLLTTSLDARADLQLSGTQAGATGVTGISATPPGLVSGGPVTVGDYRITFIASSSNSPGGPNGTLSITSLEITRLTSNFANPLYISASGTNYTAPAGAGLFSASYTANFNTSISGDNVVFDSFYDPNNRLFAETPPITLGNNLTVAQQLAIGTAAGVTPASQQMFTSPGGTTLSGALGTPVVGVTDLPPAGYSLSTRIQISEAVGSTVLITTTALVTPAAVPEPGTIAMALTAVPLLGFGAWTRRRRAQA